MIGVIDELKQVNNRSSFSSKNSVCYNGKSGYKYPSSLTQGIGFREEETVKMTVHLSNKTVSWAVNGVIRAT